MNEMREDQRRCNARCKELHAAHCMPASLPANGRWWPQRALSLRGARLRAGVGEGDPPLPLPLPHRQLLAPAGRSGMITRLAWQVRGHLPALQIHTTLATISPPAPPLTAGCSLQHGSSGMIILLLLRLGLGQLTKRAPLPAPLNSFL